MENTWDRDIQRYTRILCEACRLGNLKEVEVILRNKEVDVNGRDKKGLTPLMIAVNLGHLDIVKRLLEVPEIELQKRVRIGHGRNTVLNWACIYYKAALPGQQV